MLPEGGLPGSASGSAVESLERTDPEFMERYLNFAYDDVIRQGAAEGEPLDERTRFMAILATLLGCQGVDEFRDLLPAALNMGVTPVEAKEIVYQAVDYLGMGRVRPFLDVTNAVLVERGVTLPLPSQASTEPTEESRLAGGTEKQVEIFGEHMRDFPNAGPADRRHINRWLAANCFGDYYTRGGLDNAQREMITFCYLAAQGGVEPQLIAHAGGNLRVGNDKAFLIKVVSACLPYIGYPRSLNALRCIDEAVKAQA
ncbi:carboxymuconolactone decarboxylase family protein [Bifidobacterium simiarum]|uniref:Carboxymuconolactone decarboxylase n=1 Tax=Bifidobacterium simiarum TaxID=2045441 RepID=A0A2M9HHS3_9BIFI|nr:carboxymuconolactone decarboxylase family protein [Bifidobacterium simiarum]PJM76380.1 carboxymuconolactone decarboxylase [Bifidobacterium simiarum]